MAKKKTFPSSSKTAARLRGKKTGKEEIETPHQPTLQAMVWYKKEHYGQLLSLFDDAELLPPQYDDWLKRAEQKKAEVEAAGDQVIKVFIDPETFPQWCREKDLGMNAEARTQLAIEVAQARSFSL